MTDFTDGAGARLLSIANVPMIGTSGGAYAKALASGTMAAGLAGGATIFSFRFVPVAPVALCLVRRVLISAVNQGTAFAAGVGHFDMFAARAFSASDSTGTAGTMTTNNAKLKTGFQLTSVADFRISATAALSAGTRTLDADPMGSIMFPCSAAASAVMCPPNSVLFENKSTEYPAAFANNEGFVIQATVTGTGTWAFSVSVVWDEVEKL